MVYIFQRGTRFSRRRVFLLTFDIIGLCGGLWLALFIRLGVPDAWEYLETHLPSLCSTVLIFLLVFYAGGMYEAQAIRRRSGSFIAPVVVCGIGMAITILALYANSQATIGRGILLVATGLIVVWTYFIRRLYRLAVGYGLFAKHALVLGDHTDRVAQVIDLLKSRSENPYKLAGVIMCGHSENTYVDGVPVLGDVECLEANIDSHNIESILLTISPARAHEILGHLRPLRYAGIEIMDMVSLYEELAQEIPLDQIDDEWLLTSAMNSSVVQIRKIKRAMDIFLSTIGLLVGAFPMLLCGLLVKLTSPGPVIFKQTRVGVGGVHFTLYKLRTMQNNAEKDGAVWAQKQDVRVTKIGHFLRKWRLDEVPQLWNVMKGEMSLVGPRPERPEFVRDLEQFIPYYSERLLVQPGITGWAQVKFPYAASLEAAARKLQFDLFYIKHMSLILDISILLRTFKTIIVGLRHEEDEDGFSADSHG